MHDAQAFDMLLEPFGIEPEPMKNSAAASAAKSGFSEVQAVMSARSACGPNALRRARQHGAKCRAACAITRLSVVVTDEIDLPSADAAYR